MSSGQQTNLNVTTRKKRRGMIEKRRRDKINNSLCELRRLVPAAFEKQGSAKLEKAEILQMTVDYLRMLHARGLADSLTNNKLFPYVDESANQPTSQTPNGNYNPSITHLSQQETTDDLEDQQQLQHLTHPSSQQVTSTSLVGHHQNVTLQNQHMEPEYHRHSLAAAAVAAAASTTSPIGIADSPALHIEGVSSNHHYFYNHHHQQHHMSAAAAAYHHLSNPLGATDIASIMSQHQANVSQEGHQQQLLQHQMSQQHQSDLTRYPMKMEAHNSQQLQQGNSSLLGHSDPHSSLLNLDHHHHYNHHHHHHHQSHIASSMGKLCAEPSVQNSMRLCDSSTKMGRTNLEHSITQMAQPHTV